MSVVAIKWLQQPKFLGNMSSKLTWWAAHLLGQCFSHFNVLCLPGDPGEMKILVPEVWGELGSTFLTSSQVILLLQLHGPHNEQWCYAFLKELAELSSALWGDFFFFWACVKSKFTLSENAIWAHKRRFWVKKGKRDIKCLKNLNFSEN